MDELLLGDALEKHISLNCLRKLTPTSIILSIPTEQKVVHIIIYLHIHCSNSETHIKWAAAAVAVNANIHSSVVLHKKWK